MIRLISAPFGSVTHPPLAPAVMKAQLDRAGLPTRVLYLNLDFARMIGFGAYESIAYFKGVETQVGEWLFARAAWDREFGPSEEEFIRSCGEELGLIPHVSDQGAWLRKVRGEVVPAFLAQALDRLAEGGLPRVVGFSCTFFQTIASLALGRAIRARWPEIRLVYGGACFHGEMGEELARAAPWIDAASTGECDDVIVPLMQALAEDRAPAGLHGILYRERRGGPLQRGPAHQPVSAAVMEALPDPDYDDFFADARRVGLAGRQDWEERLLLPFESARGCWWGEKRHCTFCGLNGEGMEFRARSGERVLDMLRGLHARYPRVKRFQAADNILDMRYHHELLPALPIPGVELFWSIKANLRREQVAAMADAGIRYVQPGIESLSSGMLRGMRKGISALQNVYFLRLCRELGVLPFWNNLVRMPGETAEDYTRMTAWVARLQHLRPPWGGAPKVELHRFSPYFFEERRYVSGRRPMRWYRGLYPADQVDIDKVAYYFEADWKDVLGGDTYDALRAATEAWSLRWRQGEIPALVARDEGEGMVVLDTRGPTPREHHLDAEHRRVLLALDAPVSRGRLERLLPGLSPEALDGILSRLEEDGLVLQDEGSWLALPVPEGGADVSDRMQSRTLKRVVNQGASRPATAAR